ncbi:hypothetical protein C0Q70_04525 [Pomacea canaliculata]|uniref:Tectonic-1-3 domain-containing protein n=1 Tax=Pomacea canaliculata TaxID=400727 RepID=A0A2T7PIM5_POMCA|nr:hypothetical protein C0Q70_04525 [Pomacea canaliculata]
MNGDCMTDASSDRISVVFGVNMRTGCNIRVSASNITSFCAMMHQAIINAFEFDSIPELTPSIYAPQGYVDNNRMWVSMATLMFPRQTPLATSSSCQLPLGMEIQILFANIGALVNPQAKIIGVSFVYDTLRTVQIRCTGPSCQSGSDLNQTVEITQSVAFIDVSKPAVGFQGEPPIFLAKVPYDFFYPFISGAVSSTMSITLLQLLLMVSLTFIAV